MTTEPAPSSSRQWRIFPAVAIVAIGLLFLANNLGYDLAFLDRGNWWAVIILLAALAPLGHAYERYRTVGRFDADVLYSILSAAGVALVGVLFLFQLDWGIWWPLFVVLGGLFMLIPHRHRHRRGSGEESDTTVGR